MVFGSTKHSITKTPTSVGIFVSVCWPGGTVSASQAPQPTIPPGPKKFCGKSKLCILIEVRFERGATALTLIQCFGASHRFPLEAQPPQLVGGNIKLKNNGNIKENAPPCPSDDFQIGGPARFVVSAHSVEDIKDALEIAKEKGLSVFILGGGVKPIGR